MKKNPARVKTFCIFLFVVSFFLSLQWSSSSFGIQDFLRILIKELKGEELTGDLPLAKTILFAVRLPRVLTAALCGASLGLAGVLSQGLFRNPLASPSLMGSTSGGLLGAILYLSFMGVHGSFLALSFFSFLGSLFTTACMLFLFYKLKGNDFTRLLLVGLSLSTFTGALCHFIISSEDHDPGKSLTLYRWFMGGFYHTEWSHFFLSFPVLSICLFGAFELSKELDVLALGDEVAQSLGVSLETLKAKSLLLLSLLLGVVTSLAGPLPFVGLMAPHITRELLGAPHKKLMKYTLVNSITLVLLADLISKNIFSHKELELGILLSLIGAPFFLFLTLRRRSL